MNSVIVLDKRVAKLADPAAGGWRSLAWRRTLNNAIPSPLADSSRPWLLRQTWHDLCSCIGPLRRNPAAVAAARGEIRQHRLGRRYALLDVGYRVSPLACFRCSRASTGSTCAPMSFRPLESGSSAWMLVPPRRLGRALAAGLLPRAHAASTHQRGSAISKRRAGRWRRYGPIGPVTPSRPGNIDTG
jgi:hypothetical protein